MKINIKGFITSKKSELYSDCADNYHINKENNKFAMSDGVSKSFFSKVWSDVLVKKYVNQKDWKDNNEFIVESQKEWQSKIDEIVNQSETKWFTKSQYIRKDPALATFVGLQFIESEQKWIAQALGDSFLFFIPKGVTEIENKLSSKPEPIVFDNFPDYLSSIANYPQKGKIKAIKGEKLKEGTFYLMTDALAEWFLINTEQAKQKLDNIKTQEQYLETIANERNANRLNDDDSAVLILELFDDGKKEISYSKNQETNLNDLITYQEAEIEKRKQEKEAEIQKSNELETLQNESQTSASSATEITAEPPIERFISKGINVVKGFLSGKEKEENKEDELTEKNTSTELEDVKEQTSEQLIQSTEQPSESETTEAEKQNSENDKNEEKEKDKIEEEANNEKIEPKNLEPKEQPKVDSKAKNIFDKF